MNIEDEVAHKRSVHFLVCSEVRGYNIGCMNVSYHADTDLGVDGHRYTMRGHWLYIDSEWLQK
jgi:hypothetical protein